tara:strand:+ start:626 stop:874 length:249 start_codon:yes stop_codon:yes gene_type:complete
MNPRRRLEWKLKARTVNQVVDVVPAIVLADKVETVVEDEVVTNVMLQAPVLEEPEVIIPKKFATKKSKVRRTLKKTAKTKIQ